MCETVDHGVLVDGLRDANGEVIGCLYLYRPAASDEPTVDAAVRSWVRVDHADGESAMYQLVSSWLREAWPFVNPAYAPLLA